MYEKCKTYLIVFTFIHIFAYNFWVDIHSVVIQMQMQMQILYRLKCILLVFCTRYFPAIDQAPDSWKSNVSAIKLAKGMFFETNAATRIFEYQVCRMSQHCNQHVFCVNVNHDMEIYTAVINFCLMFWMHAFGFSQEIKWGQCFFFCRSRVC